MGGRRIWPRWGDGIVEYDDETAKIRSLKILIKNNKNGGYINVIFVKKKTALYQLSNFFNLCLEMDWSTR